MERAALTAAAEAAISAVGLDHGVVHTELRMTSAGPRIIEINPRPAGNQITELIRLVTGVDLPRVAVELALGFAPAPVAQAVGAEAPPPGAAIERCGEHAGAHQSRSYCPHAWDT